MYDNMYQILHHSLTSLRRWNMFVSFIVFVFLNVTKNNVEQYSIADSTETWSYIFSLKDLRPVYLSVSSYSPHQKSRQHHRFLNNVLISYYAFY